MNESNQNKMVGIVVSVINIAALFFPYLVVIDNYNGKQEILNLYLFGLHMNNYWDESLCLKVVFIITIMLLVTAGAQLLSIIFIKGNNKQSILKNIFLLSIVLNLGILLNSPYDSTMGDYSIILPWGGYLVSIVSSTIGILISTSSKDKVMTTIKIIVGIISSISVMLPIFSIMDTYEAEDNAFRTYRSLGTFFHFMVYNFKGTYIIALTGIVLIFLCIIASLIALINGYRILTIVFYSILGLIEALPLCVLLVLFGRNGFDITIAPVLTLTASFFLVISSIRELSRNP